MAAVPSTMPALGNPLYHFTLPDMASKKRVSVSHEQAIGKPVLLMFICNHCPYVIHIIEPLVALANQAQQQGFAVFAIGANDAEAYPQDGPEAMALFAEQYGFEFPYLYDQSQSVAKSFGAACTPDFFVYDGNHRLQYRGRMDASRPGNELPVTGQDLSGALADVRVGRATTENQVASIGCNIKWRVGNEPDYF